MTRVAIIGSGFASAHVNAIAQLPDVELVAVCSRNEQSARDLITQSGELSAEYYAFEKSTTMLQKESLDAVYLALPPFLYGDLAIACAEHVPAVFLEKPIGIDLETANKTAEAFDSAGTIVSVGYMNRYRANLQSAREYFQSNTAILFNGGWCGDMPGPYWWRRRELSGGQFTEQCTHILDAVRYLGGEVKEVQAMSTRGFITGAENFNVDDAMVMNFLLESGAAGSIQTSCFAEDSQSGVMGIHLTAASREKTYRFENHSFDLSIHHSSDRVDGFPSQENAVLLENRAFIRAVQTGDSSGILSHYRDAVETLKFSLAADLSIQEKRTVSLSELK